MSQRISPGRRRPSRRARPFLEGMEPRPLLSGLVNAFTVPTANAGTLSIAPGPDGNLWFTEFTGSGTTGKIGAISPTTGALGEITIPVSGAEPYQIVAGPDGNMWFTDGTNGAIGELNMSTKVITEYSIPTPGSGPTGITAGPDGNLWFSEYNGDKVGSINPGTHAIVDYALPTPVGGTITTGQPVGIAKGSDGKLWIAVPNINELISFDPTAHAFAQYMVPTASAQPQFLTSGPDGKIWFTEAGGSKVGSIDPTSHAFAEYATPTPSSVPTVIVATAGGNLFFAESGTNKLGEINPTTKVVTERSTASYGSSGTSPFWVTTGSDGNLWFTFGSASNRQIGQYEINAIGSNVYIDPLGNATFRGGPRANASVYLDLNHNGKLDAGEPTTVTDQNGNYVFSRLTPGSYTVGFLAFPGDTVTGPAGSSITVSLSQDGSVGPYTFGVIPITTVTPLTPNATPFGTHNPDIATAEVNGYYQLVLGRASDPTGRAAAVARLNGGAPLGEIISDLMNSAEYFSTRVVPGDYMNYLGRAASQSEINAVTARLQAGLTPQQLAIDLIGSAEFSARFSSNASFVQAAYGDTLGRQASSAEVTAVSNLLSSGTSRNSVATSLLTSKEAYTRAANGFYLVFLARVGDPGGLNNAVSLLLSGSIVLTESAVDLGGSPEYMARAKATVG